MSAFTLEKWTGRGILALSLVFILWFGLAEAGGLVAFARFMADSVSAVPDSINTVIDYYRALSAKQLLPSALVGGIGGLLVAAVMTADWRRPWPGLTLSALVGGGLAVAAAYALGLIFLNAVLVGLAAAIIVSLIIQPEMRIFLAGWTGKPYLLVIGMLVGALGSQLLVYPTQHCTYAAEAPIAERQIGMMLALVGGVVSLVPVLAVIQQRSRQATAQSGHFKGIVLPLLLLAPTLLSLLVFLYYPATEVINLSLKLRRHPLPQERFVCLQNYTALVEDQIYQNSFATTLLVTVAVVLRGMSAALSIAVLASQKVHGAVIYLTLLIWPYALSPVVMGVIFLTMFQTNSGLINHIFGLDADWLTDEQLAPLVIVFASVWNILGFNVLFYIAGLQNIPEDLLEAAEIDGANWITRFFRITFPLLSPFTFFLLITNVTYSFYGIYGAVDTLTQGGPPLGPGGQDGGATNVLIYKLYQDAFSPGSPAGAAAAQALILFLLVAGLTLVQFRYLERRVVYAD